MNWDEMMQALREAKAKLSSADRIVGDIASVVVGRLRSGHVSDVVLKALKRELKGYNIHTRSWSK